MFAVGVLAFIFVDVMSDGLSIVDDALDAVKDHHQSLGYLIWLVVLLGGGFALGSAGLAMLERQHAPGRRAPAADRRRRRGRPCSSADRTGRASRTRARRRALRTGLTIAAAIGVHNFAEGLAIGVSARAGAISLATVLIIGFALHNATEGFGIVGPLGDVRPRGAGSGSPG